MLKVSLVKYSLPALGDSYFRSALWFIKYNHTGIKIECGAKTIHYHAWVGSKRTPALLSDAVNIVLFGKGHKEYLVGYSDMLVQNIFTFVETMPPLPKTPVCYYTLVLLTGVFLPVKANCVSVSRDIINFIFKAKLKHQYSADGLVAELYRARCHPKNVFISTKSSP